MADNEIVYEIKADPKSAKSAIKDIDASAAQSGSASGGIGKLTASIASIGPVAIAAATAIATYLVGQGLKSAISEAIDAENALNRMNQALNNAGRLSVSSSQDLQEFSSYIQNTTLVSDDAAMSLISLATAFTQTNEQSKQLVQTAVNLSAAMGVSAETAVRQLGGTLNGMVGTLGKVVPEVRNLTEEQLKSGVALDLVAKKFAGAGAAAAQTFGGKITQLKMTLSDTAEEIGFFFTKSKTLGFIFDSAKKSVIELNNTIGIFRVESGDIFAPILRGILTFAQYIVVAVGPALDLINNAFNHLRNTALKAGEAFYAFFSGDYGKAIDLAQDTLSTAMDTSQFKLFGTQAGVDWLEGLKEQITLNSGILQEALPEEMRGGIDFKPKDPEETLQSLDMLTLAYTKMFDIVIEKAEGFKVSIKKNFDELKKSLFTTFIQGIGKAMNAFGQALVTGENVLQAFGKAVLGMLGELAMQMGMFFFLEGIAYFASGDYGRGAALMAGGLALMAFGGVLQALSGGGGGSPAASTSAASSGGSSTAGTVGDVTTAQGDVAERERTTQIEVNIAGNVLGDKRTLGLEIADALNEAFGNDGIIIARGAIS